MFYAVIYILSVVGSFQIIMHLLKNGVNNLYSQLSPYAIN